METGTELFCGAAASAPLDLASQVIEFLHRLCLDQLFAVEVCLRKCRSVDVLTDKRVVNRPLWPF